MNSSKAIDFDVASRSILCLWMRKNMELMTISTLSKQLNISTRTLRYYEEIGLIKNSKMPGYAYRVYDDEAITGINQILILRKLNLSLNQITLIFQKNDAEYVLEVFRGKIEQIDRETSSLCSLFIQ